MAQLWGGRFTEETDDLVYRFNQSIGFDKFEYIERSGVHDWAVWKGCYPKFMSKLGKYFK